jgi:hypothetical protein
MQAERALLLDKDGPTIWRIPFQMAALPIHARYIHYSESLINPQMPKQEPQPMDMSGISSVGEGINLAFHYMRKVRPGVKEALEKTEGTDIYGNTGRENKLHWVALTVGSLKDAGIKDKFKGIFFKDKCLHSWEGKAIGIKKVIEMGYKTVRHVDDNPGDILILSQLFPDVEFVILCDWSTNYLLHDLEPKNYPNVCLADNFDDAVNKPFPWREEKLAA